MQSLRPDVSGAAGASTLRLPLVADDRKDSNGNSLNLSRLAGAAASRDRSRLFNVTRNGRVVVVDWGSDKVIRTADMGLGADRWVSTTPVLAPDESSLFVPTGRVAERSSGQADQVLVIDTRSMKVTRTIKTSQPFWSLTASPDGAHLYAVDLHRQAIIDLDSQTGGQLGLVGGVGDTPSLALPVR